MANQFMVGYGTLAWTVRGIYKGYVGWFDENPATMYPIPVNDAYPELVAMAGEAERVGMQARELLTQDNVMRAPHLADIALSAEPDSTAALQVRLDALNTLLARSEIQTRRAGCASVFGRQKIVWKIRADCETQLSVTSPCQATAALPYRA